MRVYVHVCVMKVVSIYVCALNATAVAMRTTSVARLVDINRAVYGLPPVYTTTRVFSTFHGRFPFLDEAAFRRIIL